jgi:transposase InsO family protein
MEVMHCRVFCVKGLPLTIVSDRGTAFVSTFWRRYCERYGVKNKLSSSYHPETDGQTEIANKMIKNYLRSFINYVHKTIGLTGCRMPNSPLITMLTSPRV